MLKGQLLRKEKLQLEPIFNSDISVYVVGIKHLKLSLLGWRMECEGVIESSTNNLHRLHDLLEKQITCILPCLDD